MKKFLAFTLGESLIVMVIISIVYVALLHVLRPGNIRQETMIKAGVNMLIQIDYATKQIIAKNTNNYILTRLKDNSGDEFSIADSGADSKLITLYKKVLLGLRKTPSSTYTSSSIVGTSLTISSFTQGFLLKNGAYFAIKLNGNCTTSETTIYNPSFLDKKTATNSCGLIFFDINGEDDPNSLGVDQYIISIGKNGVK